MPGADCDPGGQSEHRYHTEEAAPPPAHPPAPLRLTAGVSPIPLSLHAGLARVERLDLLGVLLVDRLALELHRRGQLVAAGLPLLRQDLELLDLLDPGELGVRLVDRGLDRLSCLLLLG